MSRRGMVLLIGSHAVVLAVGLIVGAWFGGEAARRANAVVEDISAIDRMGSYVLSQRMLGNQATYEAALVDYLSWLERRYAEHRSSPEGRVIATDIALTHTRLALLAETRGDPARAARHYAEAMAQCPTAFMRNCSIDGLRAVLVARDGKSLRQGARPK